MEIAHIKKRGKKRDRREIEGLRSGVPARWLGCLKNLSALIFPLWGLQVRFIFPIRFWHDSCNRVFQRTRTKNSPRSIPAPFDVHTVHTDTDIYIQSRRRGLPLRKWGGRMRPPAGEGAPCISPRDSEPRGSPSTGKERGKYAWATHPWAGVWYGYMSVCAHGAGGICYRAETRSIGTRDGAKPRGKVFSPNPREKIGHGFLRHPSGIRRPDKRPRERQGGGGVTANQLHPKYTHSISRIVACSTV